MKNKTLYGLVGAALVIAPLFVYSAPLTDAQKVENLKAEIQSYRNEITRLKALKINGGRDRAIELLEDEINVVDSKVRDLESKLGLIVSFTRTLERGSRGDDVSRLQGILKQWPDIYPEALVTGFFGSLTEKAVKKFQELNGIDSIGIVGPKTRAALNSPSAVTTQTQGPAALLTAPARPSELPRPLKDVEIAKTAKKGDSGEHVKKTQEFLSMFSEIYPNGEATGFYGEQTERAVKKFQEKVGLGQTGEVDEKTKETLNLLLVAGEKKKPPKITDVTPSEGSAGITVTLSGKGFTDDSNSIMMRGKIVATDLKSYENNTQIDFILTSDAPCQTGSNKACPIKVVNQNGISNAKPFKLTEFSLVPPDIGPNNPPKPEPPEKPTPKAPGEPIGDGGGGGKPLPPVPVITSISPIKGPVWTQVTLTGSGFTSTGNSINFGGVVGAVLNLASADGKTLVFNVPGTTPCKIGETCAISVTNANGTSNEISFLLTQYATPVKVVFPNGGENLVQGVNFTLSWIGGTDRVEIVLVEDGAVLGADPGAFIVGWIATSTKPNGTVIWNAKTVCNVEGTVCTPVSPGSYKIMALSENELGLLTIWDDFTNLAGNWDLSDRAFSVSPSATLTVVVPNGGEIGSQNSAIIICWGTIDLKSQNVKIELLKNGVSYRTIYSSYPQNSPNGAFITNWTIPTDIPEGTDYQIKISDVASPAQSDTSDKNFSITAASSAIRVYSPAWGRIWYGGFGEYVSWYSTNIQSKTVNINLWKGGFFYKSIAQNVLQGYYYYYGGTGYTTGWFSHYIGVPNDLPTGNDYMVEVADASNPSVRGFSTNFSVVQYPTYLTVKGRLVDYVNKTPIANAQVYTWDKSSWGGSSVLTNLNGEFTLTTRTADILLSWGHSFHAYPAGYNPGYFVIQSGASGLYAYVNLFPFVGKSYSFSVTSGEVNVGEIAFWPFVEWSNMVSEIQTRSSLNYRHPETGQSGGGYWGSQFNHTNNFWKAIPQAADVWARLEDKPGNVYYSPMLNLPPKPPVNSTSLSLFNSVVKWEPYAISAGAYFYPELLKVGTKLSGYAYAWSGVPPYTWSILSGSFPPGVVLSADGTISGAPTVAGVYEAHLRVEDANKVNGATDYWPLRFNVRTESGAEVPTIKIFYPQARQEHYTGGGAYLQWQSFGILGKSVNIELLKSGNVVKKVASYAQSAESGYYYTNWTVPTDLESGTDYQIRISDASNSTVYGESDLFIIISHVASFNWSRWNATYSPYISWGYATSTNPTAVSYKLYQQKTGEIAPTAVATFSVPNCSQSQISGKWIMFVGCYRWYLTPLWQIYYSPYAPASEFPPSEYIYEVRAVDSAGQETVIAKAKFRLSTINISSPLSTDSPLTSPTPTFRWTIPKDWPSTLEKPYRVYVWEEATGSYVHNMYGVSAPTDTTGFRKYDGPALDPTKKYKVEVNYQKTYIDPASATYTTSIGISYTPVTFWIGQ